MRVVWWAELDVAIHDRVADRLQEDDHDHLERWIKPLQESFPYRDGHNDPTRQGNPFSGLQDEMAAMRKQIHQLEQKVYTLEHPT